MKVLIPCYVLTATARFVERDLHPACLVLSHALRVKQSKAYDWFGGLKPPHLVFSVFFFFFFYNIVIQFVELRTFMLFMFQFVEQIHVIKKKKKTFR